MPHSAVLSPDPDVTCEACLGRHRSHTRKPGCRYFAVPETPGGSRHEKSDEKPKDDPMADIRSLLLEIRREQRQQRDDIEQLRQARSRSVSRPREDDAHDRVGVVSEGTGGRVQAANAVYVPPLHHSTHQVYMHRLR